MPADRQFARVAMLATLACIACNPTQSSDVRGRGLSVASLDAANQAHVYEAAARTAFQVDDPDQSLLLDRRTLPRVTGLAADGRVSDAVAAELRSRGVIKGTCEPKLVPGKQGTRCAAARPGYVIRFSPVFTIKGDSTQVYLYAQAYGTPTSGVLETLRFERAYQVVKRGGSWSAVREGQVPKEVRGEIKR